MKQHSTLGIPALALAVCLFTQLVSAAPLPNAWQIMDNSTDNGSTLNYTTNLTASQHQSATNSGFHFTVNARFVTDFGGSHTMAMAYGLGTRRFLIWWEVNTNGDLTAELEGGPIFTLTANGTGSALYHTHEIVYTNGSASYLFDGVVKTNNWQGSSTDLAAGQVYWGAGSSGGQGEMNFHTVTFAINGLGVVAAYDAGTAGNPPVAPDPSVQGWTQSPAVPAPGTIGRPIAADTIGALPNAWQITDNSGTAGTLTYTTNLTASQRIAATNITGGFHYTVNARFVTNFADTKSLAMAYGLGGTRFLIWWNLTNGNNLIADLDGQGTFTLTTNGTGTTLYHTHEIIYNPTNKLASYLVDGQVMKTNWTASASDLTAGQVFWGAGSSAGQGQVNFHSVQFQINGLGTVASYDAGMIGNPLTATNPVTQGWTMTPAAPSTSATNAISPDVTLLPEAATFAADQFAPGSAQLNGQANPSGSPAMAWFEWGTTMLYGSTTSPQSVGGGISSMDFSNSISGLVVGTDYYFRAVVSNAFGVAAGADKNFNLAAFLPLVTTLAADQFTTNSARLNGQVNPNGWPAVAWFEWGTNTSYGNTTLPQSVGAGITNELVTDGIGGLAVGTNYFFRAVGSNSFGVAVGANRTFNLAALRPLVTTLPADQLTSTSARLNGWVNPRGWPTIAWFEWGTDTNYGNATTPQNLGSGITNVAVSDMLAGLVVGPNYHFRLVATNAFGIAAGTDQAFNLSFLPTTTSGLPGVSSGSVAWGDYDNDGRLDFLLTGSGISQLWRNTGSGFTNVTATVAPGLPGVNGSSVAWGDYDNDGRLDFLITGDAGSTNVSQLWRNTGSGFSNVTASVAPGLPGVANSSVAWGDYDNDGRLDFLLTGNAGSTNVSQLWRNTGSGFSNVTASVAPGLPGVANSSVAWGDYDNDGRLDFLLTGNAGSTNVSQLWRNTGSGFSNVMASVVPGLPGIRNSSVAWGDYDNDGRLDFLFMGTTNTGNVDAISQLWQNTGSGFTNVTIPGLPGVDHCSVAWGDCDNDGRLDFLFTGHDRTGTPFSQVWRNTGSGFSNVVLGLPGVILSSTAWGDYDNDGRLDCLITGSGISQLLQNNVPVSSNVPPAAPAGLSATVTGMTVSLNWSAALDDHTPAAGLNYNVRIGSVPGASDVLSPMSFTNGLRLLPALGNAQTTTDAVINLPFGQYYWSVQAVDTSFAGSPFALEQQFTIAPPRLINPVRFPNGIFEFNFINQTVLSFDVLVSTNAALPLNKWTNLGPALPLGGGLYRFTDLGAIGQAKRFYLLRQQ